MDITIKEKFDKLMQEINGINDLNQKMELYNYIFQQADYCIYSLNEEQRQYENNNSY